MDIYSALLKSLNDFSPALIVAVITIIILGYYLYKKSQFISDYKQDKFRIEIENRISELSNQLTITNHRFENVNHLLLTGNKISNSKSEKFFEKYRINSKTPEDHELIFVLTPFNPSYNSIYNNIKSVIESTGFRCMRGDEKQISGPILPHILEQIYKARLVIANISGRNPNVYYELGIAHAIGKDVLLIAESGEDIPFDIKDTRVLLYKNEDDIENKLKNWLIHTFAQMSLSK